MNLTLWRAIPHIPTLILAAYITALLLLIIIYGVRYYLYQREEWK